jgi:starch synthase (maltosyl-transferring)
MPDLLERDKPAPRRAKRRPAAGPDPAPPVASAPASDAPDNAPVISATPRSPAIYHVPREKLGSASGWPDHFARAQALGFNTVLFAAPFQAAADPSAPRLAEPTLDFDLIDPAFGGGDALFRLAEAATAARAAGLALALDLALEHVAADSPLLREHPDWFVHSPRGAAFRYLAESDATVDWWDEKIAAWQAAGIAGFRCLAPTRIPPAVWARLIAAARQRDPGAGFWAWTPGTAPADLPGLQGAGFGQTFSSSCWWDFSAPWLNEDTARLEAIAPVIALTAPPGAAGWSDAAIARALRLAAILGAGWLLESGFADHHATAIAELNALRDRHDTLREAPAARAVSSPGAAIAILTRGGGAGTITIAVNPSLATAASIPAASIFPTLGLAALTPFSEAPVITPAANLALEPGEVALFTATPAENIFLPVAVPLATDSARIGIEAITPQVDQGQFPVRKIVGELVGIEADLIADGHDKLAGEVLFRALDEQKFRAIPLRFLENDRWGANIPLERCGRHVFAVSAWKDAFATFVDEVTKKHAAGVDTSLELQEGMALVWEAATKGRKQIAPRLNLIFERLRAADEDARREILLSEEMASLMREAGVRKFATTSHRIILDAERAAAGFAAWYEIFPRSQTSDPARHGTFKDVIAQLPRIAGMGFDVLYFPPIHPIGRRNRKGRNNTLTPAPDDPGSPYAIGNEAGGHDAIHPELGTLEDFRELRAAAAAHGLELALDFAIQCAPDHPWLQEHPEWFDWRPDGSLRYAENPPKKYQDIVNVDFYAAGAQPSLWLALRDVVQFWADQGIRLFRVDNPHTKPFPFWEWLIADIRSRHPDAVFLAEAFTRPKVMYRLAKIGFSQSYTYFTWRNTKAELEAYITEITTTAPKDFFRPHFFVNTPDINPVFLQTTGRPGHLIRAALAATLAGLWGVYNGFELCEATPLAPGKEEYLDSEKYQIKLWDHDRPGNIVPEITRLNRIRKANAALHSHLNVEFLPASNDQVIYFRKFAADGNTLLIAISLDPAQVQDAIIELPLWRFGLADDGALHAEDLMRDVAFIWHGKYQPVRFNPAELPFCIWRVFP